MINPILLLCILTWLGSIVGVVYTTASGCVPASQDIPLSTFQHLLGVFGG